jgi:hypothetical protein
MTAVNWNDPSTGLVNDPKPSLTLRNNKGGALVAKSRGIAMFAISPGTTGLIAGNRNGLVPAAGGASVVDPAAPNSLGGIGVLGATNRLAAIGTAGIGLGQRCVGVLGEALDSGIGIVGRGSQTGVQGTGIRGNGVSGFSQTDGGSAGVYGYGPGPGGAGVRGISVAGVGAEGRSTAGPGVYGTSDDAQGVVGEATAPNAAGVSGRNDAGTGVGVDGFSSAGTAVRATSSKGFAVDAQSFSGTVLRAQKLTGAGPAIDVYSGSSAAVKAESLISTAVEASALSSGVKATVLGGTPSAPGAAVEGILMSGGDAVKGTAAFNGAGLHGVGYSVLNAWAGLFDGDVSVKGILFKYASFFSIDHPLDPKRKVLNHASVEGPEYKTFYDGIVRLDRTGRGRVRLPRWFAALNGNLRHQLTAMGAAAPDLHVASTDRDSFVVAGGRPGQRVCWQVTGVRRDAWARAHPLEVEQRKRPQAGRPAATPAELRSLRASLRRAFDELKAKRAAIARDVAGRRPPAGGKGPTIARRGALEATSRAAAKQAAPAIRSARSALRK